MSRAMRWLDPFVGPTLGIDVGLNGGKQQTVKIWRADAQGNDQIVLIDTTNLTSDRKRQALITRLPEPDRAEAADLLLAVAHQITEEREPGHPTEPPTTLQPCLTNAEQVSLFDQCKSLATLDDILSDVVRMIRRLGVAGADRLVCTLYLVLTTRLLERPTSLAIKGPSAGGKSFPVEQTLRLFPPEAYLDRTAMSERALAYGTESLSHRTLVLYEAAGMGGEVATYMLRSLLSEGRVKYETVGKVGDELQSRIIEREGPTGLVVTTTRAQLHPENETRMLSITVDDTQDQTRRVFEALARDKAGDPTVAAELELWRDLQRWLATGEQRVVIPYATKLAEMIPPVAVRLRRDFGTLLNLIRGHALLHRAIRARDRDGRIIATIQDYAAVRELTLDLFGAGVDTTVADTIRQTVNAVANDTAENGNGGPTTVAAVARRLGLEKSSALRRVQVAIAKGYLENQETGKGRPARLVVGDPLPEDIDLLPVPQRLKTLELCKDTCNHQPPESHPVAARVAGLQAQRVDGGATCCDQCGYGLTSDGECRECEYQLTREKFHHPLDTRESAAACERGLLA